MRAKSVVLLVVALGCGLVAAIGITEVMAKRGSSHEGGETAVVVANKNISMGEPVKADMVRVEQWPAERVPPGVATSLENVEGRRTKCNLIGNCPVFEEQLLGKGIEDSGASGAIRAGYRVIPVKVDDVSGLGTLIRPADRVDVLVHVQPKGENQENVTRTVLQNVKVFAVGDQYEVASAAGGDKKAAARTVSLEVTPDEAEVVALACELGSVRLVLRSPEDTAERTSRGSRVHDITGGGRLAAAGVAASGLLPGNVRSWLDQAKKSATGQQAPKADAQRYTVRMIAGGQISDVVMESKAPGANDQPPWMNGWTLLTPSAENRSAHSPAATDAAAKDAPAKDAGGEATANSDAPPKGDAAKSKDAEPAATAAQKQDTLKDKVSSANPAM